MTSSKLFVDYSNLIDKERMVRNLENSLKYNELITDDESDLTTLKQLSETKENIELGKDILNKQAERIYKKYYPELSTSKNFSAYYTLAITQETLGQDKVLSQKEIVDVLSVAREKRSDFMLKSIVKNPHIQPVRNYQKSLAGNQK